MSARADYAGAMPLTPETLKQRRHRLGLSQRALADALGMSGTNGERSVRRWEQGETPIPGAIGLALKALEHGLDAD